ncbi:MAG TPA: cytochrome c [Candidatus Acidoferrum sp.]|nr:cytochrome c [Candidatus Acidoferrum sp.]
MMKVLILILGIIFFACSLRALAQPQTPAANKSTAKPASSKSAIDEGEKTFKQNCGRCHIPPEAISHREAKAVLQHMRVRAMLTAEDEQLILKYLAP